MGRFGISFSNQTNQAFRIDGRKHYATLHHGGGTRKDGPFQRALAWVSYFVMVFVAVCAFNAPAVAAVVDSGTRPMKEMVEAISDNIADVQDRKASPWALRGTL